VIGVAVLLLGGLALWQFVPRDTWEADLAEGHEEPARPSHRPITDEPAAEPQPTQKPKATPQSKLAGKWHWVDVPFSMDFLQDGTVVFVTGRHSTWNGSYRFPDTGRIAITNLFGSNYPEQVLSYSVKDGKLVLTTPVGDSMALQRQQPKYDLGKADPAVFQRLGGRVSQAAVLTDAEVRRHLEKPYSGRTANLVNSRMYLDEALRLKDEHGLDVWKLHKVVHAFKVALRYSGGPNFSNAGHQKAYLEYLNKLTEEFSNRYRAACLLEKNKEWPKAKTAFQELVKLLGDKDKYNPLYENIQNHLNWVEQQKP